MDRIDELMLDVGQANELKLAARRAGATNADLKELSSKDMLVRILPVLRGLSKVVRVAPFPIWQTISIGATAKNSNDFITVFDSMDNKHIGDHVISILRMFPFQVSKNYPMINVVKVSGYDLGFNDKLTLDEILAQAATYDLGPCSCETALELRWKYNGPHQERLNIAMNPITISDEDSVIFITQNNCGHYALQMCFVQSHTKKFTFDPREEWIFESHQKK